MGNPWANTATGSLLSQPDTGTLVTLAIDATPRALVENCTYVRASGTISSGTACAMTGTRTFTMTLNANDTDPNITSDVPTDGIGDAVTGAILTATGTGVAVSANNKCNPAQAAIMKSASRATIANNCNGTLTITVNATAPAAPITFTYGAVDDLGAQSISTDRVADTVTVQ